MRDRSGRRVRPRRAGEEVAPVGLARRRLAEQRERGRHDVDHAGEFLDHRAGSDLPRRDDEERDRQRLFVEQEAVLVLAVGAEPLAVIGQHHDRGPPRRPRLLERGDQLPDEVVGERDLAAVGVAGVALAERRRGCVGRVRVEQVDPGEERPAAVLGQPVRRVRGGLRPRPLAAPRAGVVVPQVVVEQLEPLPQPEQARGGERGDEGRGRPAAPAQLLGQRGDVVRQPEAGVVAHAVRRRVEPREDRGVGRRRQRDGGPGARHARPLRGQRVQVRRGHRGGAVARDVVGAQRVERDQQQRVDPARGGPGRAGAAAAGETPRRGEGGQNGAGPCRDGRA